jgi:hypothetical protein
VKKKLAYKTFLHHTYTVAAFMAVLYLICAWAWHRVHKRPSAPVTRPLGNGKKGNEDHVVPLT